MGKIIIFDTETTGFKPGQIAQLTYAILDTETRKAVGKNFFFTVNKMDSGAESIHKLSISKLKELSQGNVFADKADEIFNDFAGNTMVGHNVDFDVRFMGAELERTSMSLEEPKTFDTMAHFKPIMKMSKKSGGGYKSPKLEEVVNFLGITDKDIERVANKMFMGFSGYHDARYDVAATCLVFMTGIKKNYIKSIA